MRRTCASTASSTSAASSSRPTTRPTASTCRPTTAATSSPGPTSPKTTSLRDYWNDALGMVRPRWRSPRRRVSRRARPLGLRPEGAAAEDRRILGHRRRQPRAGRRRTRRRARQARQPRRNNHRHHQPQRDAATSEMWIKDRKNRRVIPHRMEQMRLRRQCATMPPRTDIWKINGTRQAVYAKSALSVRDRLKAAAKLTNL